MLEVLKEAEYCKANLELVRNTGWCSSHGATSARWISREKRARGDQTQRSWNTMEMAADDMVVVELGRRYRGGTENGIRRQRYAHPSGALQGVPEHRRCRAYTLDRFATAFAQSGRGACACLRHYACGLFLWGGTLHAGAHSRRKYNTAYEKNTGLGHHRKRLKGWIRDWRFRACLGKATTGRSHGALDVRKSGVPCRVRCWNRCAETWR